MNEDHISLFSITLICLVFNEISGTRHSQICTSSATAERYDQTQCPDLL